MKKRTEPQWSNYLKNLHDKDVAAFAQKLGMKALNGLNKEEKIRVLVIHLDVMGKVA
tara:strand:+ start:320 stop:490 length:171 start_codon:yes stop_codon:yes gene_type:complete